MECLGCANGNSAGGSPGVPGVEATHLVGMGCTRKFHHGIMGACEAHWTWLTGNYGTLVCAQCADEDGQIFFIDGFEAARIE